MINLLDLAGNTHSNILLLQGPIGPFFSYLAHDLKRAGANVFKINFNGGDMLFYPFGSINYTGNLDEWPSFLEGFIKEKGIDLILLFGDCRPIHKAAHAVALSCGVEIGVFEEGYIRPDYITLERFGVNGNSTLPRESWNKNKDFTKDPPSPYKVPSPFRHAMVWAMLYNAVGTLFSPFFSNYNHHRSLHIFDGISWLKSFWRKWIYSIKERGIQERLTNELSKKYFLVPLQVGNDAQIHSHSHFRSTRAFMKVVLRSFANNANKNHYLVIKQHPLERGYSHHGLFIQKFAREYQILDRVFYIHDQHLPSLLDHALGVVLINSTVGLSALHHDRSLITLGEAIYDIPNLTFQGNLDDFWTNLQPPNKKLYSEFRRHLIQKTQINGNFYRRLPESEFKSGLVWDCKI